MRRRRRCRSCGGRYLTADRDGVLYFHACAPVGQDADGNPAERPDKRDENIDVDERGVSRGTKREGAGAEDV